MMMFRMGALSNSRPRVWVRACVHGFPSPGDAVCTPIRTTNLGCYANPSVDRQSGHHAVCDVSQRPLRARAGTSFACYGSWVGCNLFLSGIPSRAPPVLGRVGARVACEGVARKTRCMTRAVGPLSIARQIPDRLLLWRSRRLVGCGVRRPAFPVFPMVGCCRCPSDGYPGLFWTHVFGGDRVQRVDRAGKEAVLRLALSVGSGRLRLRIVAESSPAPALTRPLLPQTTRPGGGKIFRHRAEVCA